MTNFKYNVLKFSSKSLVYFSRMFSVDFIVSNWKKVVTLKTECDNLILCNFWNSTGPMDE